MELEGTWNDKETTLAVLRPVSTFIFAAVALDADALMSARTVERSDILMLSGETLRRAMQTDPHFSYAAALELAGCYRGLVRSLKNQKLRGGGAPGQLPDHPEGAPGWRKRTFTLPHEKRLLASLLGMTPENLSRAFATLTGYGVVVNGPEVTIARPVVLERLAKPDPLIDNHQPPGATPVGKAERGLLASARAS